jgi:hypothetical protein
MRSVARVAILESVTRRIGAADSVTAGAGAYSSRGEFSMMSTKLAR